MYLAIHILDLQVESFGLKSCTNWPWTFQHVQCTSLEFRAMTSNQPELANDALERCSCSFFFFACVLNVTGLVGLYVVYITRTNPWPWP